MLDSIFGQAFIINILGNLLIFVGFVLFAIVIWRSGTLPKWAGALLGLSALLLGVPADTEILSILGTYCW